MEEDVTSTGPVVSGSAPIPGGSRLSTDVPVNYSVAVCVSVEQCPYFDECWNPTGQLWCSWIAVFDESKARDFAKLTDLVLTSNACPGRPNREPECKVL